MSDADFTLDIGSDEIYPMPLFVKLSVEDVGRATDWYVEALGFKALFVMRAPGSGAAMMSHLRMKKYQDIMLVSAGPETARGAEGIAVTLNFAGDIDGFAARAAEAGAEVVAGPADTAWNTREVTFRDLDGYLLTFTFGPLKNKSFDEVIGSMR